MSSAAFRVRGLARAWCLACLVGLLACTGCGSGPSLVPVEGKVAVGDQPLSAGVVTFYPEEQGGTRLDIVGLIGTDGTFKMTTNGKAGAPKGKYKVTVNTLAPVATASPDPNKPLATTSTGPSPQRKANAKYETPDKSGLTVEVPSASYDLNLSP